MRASQSINNVKKGLKSGLTGDLLSIDIRESIHHFGRITGEISTDDLLGNIFKLLYWQVNDIKKLKFYEKINPINAYFFSNWIYPII